MSPGCNSVTNGDGENTHSESAQALQGIRRLAIIGTGLIGASVAAALKNNGYRGHIAGCARTLNTLDKALERGLIDSATTSYEEVVVDADMVLLAVPMLAMRPVLEAISPVLPKGCIVTDGGSVKGPFVADARDVLHGCAHVVPAHPIAGKEFSGVDAADAALYRGHTVILTPLEESAPDAVQTVSSLWRFCGANVETLDWQTHDRILAATSHLPHVVAFAIVDMLAKNPACDDVFRHSAGGFRDFTRIASGDPVMWRDICLSNSDEIGDILDELIVRLGHVRELLGQQNADQLQALFANAKTTRDKLIVKYDQAKQAQTDK